MSTQTNVTVTIIRTLDEHGHVSLEWPDGRPGMVACAPELIDQMVQIHNERVDARLAIDAALALHYPANNDSNRTPICQECRGAEGDHPCGCWSPEGGRDVVCGHCHSGGYKSASVPWPCETARALGAEPLSLGGPAARSEP